MAGGERLESTHYLSVSEDRYLLTPALGKNSSHINTSMLDFTLI